MINFEKIPIKDGLLFCLDGEDYDNSEKWGPNITIKNGEIAKDHSVYLKKNSNANLQGSLQIKFNNTFFFSLYMIVKFDFNETNYSYYYINDRNVLYIYTSPKQENQNNTRISLGGHEIKLNLDLTKYHLIALSLRPRTTQIMVDGKI